MDTATEKPKKTMFQESEERFQKTEANIKAMRAFIQTYRSALDKVKKWMAGDGLWLILYVREYSTSETESQSAREIARLFGPEGWIREPDRYSCGKIDWKKTIDGIQVTIEAAEQIKPLIKEVKLPPDAPAPPDVNPNATGSAEPPNATN